MVALGGSVLPAEAALTQQRELGLNLRPQLLVDQRVPPAVQSGPGGDPLPAHRAAQRSFVHRLKEAGLKNKKWHHIMDKSLEVERGPKACLRSHDCDDRQHSENKEKAVAEVE